MTVRVQEEKFNPADELAYFSKGLPSHVGAVLSFVGQVRGEANSGDSLSLEHHPVMTHKMMVDFQAQALARWDLLDAIMIHRYGVMAVGEPIVFVATAASHRRAAFEAADFLMDTLKTRAPFWKKENKNGVERWIEPTERDYQDVLKW